MFSAFVHDVYIDIGVIVRHKGKLEVFCVSADDVQESQRLVRQISIRLRRVKPNQVLMPCHFILEFLGPISGNQEEHVLLVQGPSAESYSLVWVLQQPTRLQK